MNGVIYDPATGEVVQDTTEYSIKAGILSRERTEEGGIGEEYLLNLWLQHSSSGMPHLPKTDDEVDYDGTTWKVVSIAPTYKSKGLDRQQAAGEGMTILRPDQVNDWITGKANRAFSRHIQMDQGRLAKANPKATGRMAASWRIGQGNADPSTEPGGLQRRWHTAQIQRPNQDGRQMARQQ